MKARLNTKVIVVGGDHHNTLAVIRCLGRTGCEQEALIHTTFKTVEELKISKSKYITGKASCVEEDETAILNRLLERATEEKQILFPCSDLAAYTMDVHYAQLCRWFILPGFKNQPGKVAALMDKWEQKVIAQQNNIPMAKTWKLELAPGQVEIPADVIYPCIVKPEVSAFGRKTDIVICKDTSQLRSALERLAQAGYRELVVQQFLNKKYEVCAYGCLVDNKALCAGGTIRKVREFPPKGGGSLTFAQFIDEEPVNALRDRVLSFLYDAGYRGQYDVELFVCEEGVFLNEINFRHSGNGYALVQNGVYAPFIWCADAAGVELAGKIKTSVATGRYHMDELYDLSHLKENHVSMFKWIRDLMKTSACAKWDVRDFKGTMAYYFPVLRGAVTKILLGKKRR